MAFNILIVDDDNEFRSELVSFLFDYQTIEAPDGKSALKILEEPNVVDIIILDIKLPDIKGTELLGIIKEKYPALPIIILTAYSSKETVLDAFHGHANEYLEKPIDLFKTKSIIEKLLGSVIVLNKPRGHSKIEKIKYLIERNYNKNNLLEYASKIVFLSPKYLSYLFKKETGISINSYKVKIKMKKAIEMLKEFDKNINEIAADLGYLNTISFIRIFKSNFNCTPKEYRNQLK